MRCVPRVRSFVAAAICLFLLIAPCSTGRAGTTGSLNGTVTDSATGQPIADAIVNAASPSQSTATRTDAAGRFAFLTLAPDTYTITVQKGGFNTRQFTGIAIFADQTQNVAATLEKSLKTIANVTSRSSISPVKPGTTTDVYSVNPAVTKAAAAIGGGGGLNNAYSAIASMPGAYVPPNQMGVNQTVYVRGGYFDQIGFEYDGVPVNRSFDNFPAHSAATLGQQELQIYTGGGPASSNATGLAGFINQVAKVGTYPGYLNINTSVGYPAFYHDLSVEASGATTNRLFSYYAGLQGYNQDFRYFDNSNGADLTNEFPVTFTTNATTFLPFFPAVYPTCNPHDPNFYENPVAPLNPANTGNPITVTNDPGCFFANSPNYGLVSTIRGRESLVNLHFGLPHRDGGRDDIQLLWTNSAQYRQFYTGVNDAGPDLINALVNDVNPTLGGTYAGPPQWPDFYTFPAGTQFLAPASTAPIAYMFPGSPTNRCANVSGVANSCPGSSVVPLPNDYRDARWDQAAITKLQYQHNMGDRAYLRAFGYTFYSNTNRSGAVQDGIPAANLGITNYDYEVDAHTSGAQLQFADQLSDRNQLAGTFNYVTSKTLRYFNFNDFNTTGQQISSLTNGKQCFAAATGPLANGVDSVNEGDPAPCNDPITQGFFLDPTGTSTAGNPENFTCAGGANDPIPPAACAAGASWELTYTGNQASVNSVTPKFTNYSLTDEWRPNEKLDISASMRFDRDEFDLTPIAGDPGKDFWYAQAQKEFCYNPQTFQPVIVPQPPQDLRHVNPYVSFNCPLDPVTGVQTVHPDGQNGHVLLTDKFDPTFVQTYSLPRFGMTYTVDPDTVLRLSAGRFAQEPQNYEVEYNSLEPNLAAELIGFLPYGFNTPRHDAGAQFSNNYDFSYERHFKGTDMSLKVTPYYRWATQQLYETVNISTLFGVSPSFNGGTERTDGVELEFTKGDFNRNGLSGILSYTYTNAKEKWDNYAGVPINPVDPYNQDIIEYNQLTGACVKPANATVLQECGGAAALASLNTLGIQPSACYNFGGSTPQIADPTCSQATSVINPYFNKAAQPLLDKFGWYDPGLDFPYI